MSSSAFVQQKWDRVKQLSNNVVDVFILHIFACSGTSFFQVKNLFLRFFFKIVSPVILQRAVLSLLYFPGWNESPLANHRSYVKQRYVDMGMSVWASHGSREVQLLGLERENCNSLVGPKKNWMWREWWIEAVVTRGVYECVCLHVLDL